MASADAVERQAVVDAATRGLGRAVRRDHADARPRRARSRSAGVDRAAAEQHGVEAAQRGDVARRSSSIRCSWVGTRETYAASPAATAPASDAWSSSRTGSCPATSDRQTTCNPATYDAGSASSQRPEPPRRRARGRDRGQHGAPRESTTRLGGPVDPDVSTTSGSGSPGREPVRQRVDDLGRRTGCRKSMRRTLVAGVMRMALRCPPGSTASCRRRPLARRLSVQSLLFALGEGTFITGSAVFFTQIVGLSAAQVGLGLTIAGVVSVLLRGAARASSSTGSGPSGCGRSARPAQAALYLALAVHRRLRRLRRHDGRAGGGRRRRLARPRRLHDRRLRRARSGSSRRPTCAPRSTSASPSAPWSAASRSPSTATPSSAAVPLVHRRDPRRQRRC